MCGCLSRDTLVALEYSDFLLQIACVEPYTLLEHIYRRNKEVYEARSAFFKYSVGDMVWRLHEVRHEGVNPKLEKYYDELFLII